MFPTLIPAVPSIPSIVRPAPATLTRSEKKLLFCLIVPKACQNQPDPKPPAHVPGPLPALGVAAAFGWSRKLRARIKEGGR